jgi:hypothetical protein
MNLADLSRELRSRAEEVPAAAATTRLAAVRSRIRVRRRRQATGAVAIAATGVAALVFGTQVNVDALRGSPGPAQHGPVFDDVVAGDALVASATGAPGQREVELEFTPTDTYLQLMDFCQVPAETTVMAATTINGHPFLESQCQSGPGVEGPSAPGGMTAEQNRAGWAALGVRPGRTSVIRIQLKLDPATERAYHDLPFVLGVGVYALTGPRVTSDGVPIKVDAEAGGHDYRLRDYRTARVAAGSHELSLDVPAGAWPVWVSAGIVEADGKSGRSATKLGVDDDPAVSEADGGILSALLQDARAHTVHVRSDTDGGVLMLAYYTRVD